MLDLASIRADLQEIMADLPVSCSYAGVSFTGTMSEITGGRAVEIDGVVFEADGEVICDVADVPSSIAADKPIVVAGKNYRVLSLSRHQDNVGLSITLKDPAR